MSTAPDSIVLRLPELRRIDGLIDELIEAIDEENRLLGAGLPASLAATTGAKARLANEIEAAMRQHRLSFAGRISPAERDYFAARMALTQRKAEQNASLLVGAIQASRRRIAAIIDAVREDRAGAAPVYGSGGQRGGYASTAGALTSGRIV